MWVLCSLAFLQEEGGQEGQCSRQVQEVQEEKEEEVTLSRVVDLRVPEVVVAVLLGLGVSKEEEDEAKEVEGEDKEGM